MHLLFESLLAGVQPFVGNLILRQPGLMTGLLGLLLVAGLAGLWSLQKQVRRQHQALQKGEEKYRALVENASEGVLVLQNGRAIFANRRVVELTGYTFEEISGRNFLDFIHPEDRDKVRERYWQRLQGQSTTEEYTFRAIARNGEILWVQVHSAPTSWEGKPAILAMMTDITDQKRAELALRVSEESYRSIVETALEGVWVMDAQGITRYVNQRMAEMLGYGRAEMVGRSIFDFVDPELHTEMRSRLERRRGGAKETFDLRLRRKDGEELWAIVATNPMWDEHGQYRGGLAMVTDITQRKRAEQQNERQFAFLAALRAVDTAITSSIDLPHTLELILEQITCQLGVDAADVLLLEPHSQRLVYAADYGFNKLIILDTYLPLGEGYAGQAALERRLVHIPNLSKEPNQFIASPDFLAEGFIAYYVVPLIVKDEVKGVLEVYHREPLPPNEEWLALLKALTDQAAIAIDNSNLFEDLQHANDEMRLAYDATIEGWSRALEMRDGKTTGHSIRVTEKVLKLARRMGIPEEELVQIRRGALLHDIGKMGIPDSILLKPGPLDDDEWSIMRKHPEYSYHFLSAIDFLRPALDIPYCHHEKWDGTGYPLGLKGEQIPLAARIFTVVDVWDALSEDRPYCQAWSPKDVCAYLLNQSGKHFDPQVVAEFLMMLEEEQAVQYEGPETV